MKELTISVVTDIETCEQLWEEFSPKRELYDLWHFRHLRFKHKDAEAYFVIGKHKDKIVGLLPLQWNNEDKMYEIFGRANSTYDNTWLLPGYKNCYSQFYDFLADKPVVIHLGKYQHTYKPGYIKKEEPKYILDVKGYENYEEYMEDLWREKDRKKVQKEIRRLFQQYRVEVKQSTSRALDRMFALSIQRFGEKSVFYPKWVQEMYKELAKYFETDVIAIKVNGKIEAVGMSIIYGDTYYGINSGSNRSINTLGKFLYLMKIERAINLGMEFYHAGRGDFGDWKKTFAFAPVSQRKFITSLGAEAEARLNSGNN